MLDEIEADVAPIADDQLVVVGGDGSRGHSFAELLAAEPWSPSSSPQLDDPVSIQYTSGTTGMPKGCVLTHRYWLTIGLVAARMLPDVPRRILSDTPFSYLDPQVELMMAIWSGAELVVASTVSLSRFMQRIRDYRIDYTGFWELALQLEESETDRDHDLKWVTLYGLDKDLHAELERRFGVVGREVYAMTEIGVTLDGPISCRRARRERQRRFPGPVSRGADRRTGDSRRCSTGGGRRALRPRTGDADRVLAPARCQRHLVLRRWLVPDWRPVPMRRGRSLLHRRARQGHDPTFRREHRCPRSRNGPRATRWGVRGGGRRST